MIWRKFLQPAKYDVDSYVKLDIPSKSQDYSISLKIADCTKTVILYFPWSTDKKQVIARKKLAILREALDKLEAALDNLAAQ